MIAPQFKGDLNELNLSFNNFIDFFHNQPKIVKVKDEISELELLKLDISLDNNISVLNLNHSDTYQIINSNKDLLNSTIQIIHDEYSLNKIFNKDNFDDNSIEPHFKFVNDNNSDLIEFNELSQITSIPPKLLLDTDTTQSIDKSIKGIPHIPISNIPKPMITTATPNDFDINNITEDLKNLLLMVFDNQNSKINVKSMSDQEKKDLIKKINEQNKKYVDIFVTGQNAVSKKF
jgi:hypothetical protein